MEIVPNPNPKKITKTPISKLKMLRSNENNNIFKINTTSTYLFIFVRLFPQQIGSFLGSSIQNQNIYLLSWFPSFLFKLSWENKRELIIQIRIIFFILALFWTQNTQSLVTLRQELSPSLYFIASAQTLSF